MLSSVVCRPFQINLSNKIRLFLPSFSFIFFSFFKRRSRRIKFNIEIQIYFISLASLSLSNISKADLSIFENANHLLPKSFKDAPK